MRTLAIHPFTAKRVAIWKAGKGSRNKSIHPRVRDGRQAFPKVNTAKPSTKTEG